MRRSTFTAAAVPIALLWIAFSFLSASSPELAHPMLQALVPAIWLGLPLAAAAVIITRRIAVAAEGPGFPARLVAVASAALPERRSEWGAAMTSELESIDDPLQRRRFAFGCAFAAMRSTVDRQAVLVALVAAGVIAIGTLIVSRVSRSNGRAGVFAYAYVFPILVLTTTGIFSTARGSFSRGLVTGLLALSMALVAMLAVQIAEAGTWFDTAGVHIVDGDPPKTPLSRAGVLLDPVSPQFVAFYLLTWLPWPLIGAALGSRRSKEMRPADRMSASLT